MVAIFVDRKTSPLLVFQANPEPGETWVYEPSPRHRDSPWPDCDHLPMSEPIVLTQRVLDVKEGWVKYEQLGEIKCDTVHVFKIDAHRVDKK